MKSKTLPLMAALMGPVMMFTGMAGADPGKEDLTQVYEAGRRAFNKGDLAKAKIAFAKVLLAKPDFDPSDAADFWDVVNRQDWAICERVQRGMKSKFFTQGLFAPMETPSLDIREWWKKQMGK